LEQRKFQRFDQLFERTDVAEAVKKVKETLSGVDLSVSYSDDLVYGQYEKLNL
jgi:hypothetical protein